MKKSTLSSWATLWLLFLYNGTASAQTYSLVWADEFTSGISSAWKFDTGGGGWGNNEKQYYQAANATVVNGNLLITAKKERVGANAYTSARLKTQGLKEFQYGKIEARIKMPLGQGLWPAFWMLGANSSTVTWPACGEIDVVEHINTENLVYGTTHWDSNGQHAQYGGNVATTPADYHVYAITWDASYIRWFLDGVQYHEILIANNTGSTEEFHRPFYLLLNLAVGGNWPGQTVDGTKLPATMYVDYVRVYQQSATTTALVQPAIATSAAKMAPTALTAELYPNPQAAGQPVLLRLSRRRAAAPAVSIRVLDMQGRLVWRKTTTAESLDVQQEAALQAGVYQLQVSDGTTKISKKLVVL